MSVLCAPCCFHDHWRCKGGTCECDICVGFSRHPSRTSAEGEVARLLVDEGLLSSVNHGFDGTEPIIKWVIALVAVIVLGIVGALVIQGALYVAHHGGWLRGAVGLGVVGLLAVLIGAAA